jgi:DegV family protein with EDD domain
MIRVVTDSSTDLPQTLADEHDVAVVPLTIRFGDQEFVDRADLTHDQFWVQLATSGQLPETAAPSAGSFQDAFELAHKEGADGIVAVCLSAELSATYQSAVIAAERVADRVPVRVVDSGSVTMAAGFQVLCAARAAAAGADLDEVVAAAEDVRSGTNVFASLDTLEFLKRGGRIGAAQAFFGGILNVKPLITLADGAVAPAGRVRTRSKALAAIVEHVAGLGEVQELAVLHGAADDVDELTTMLSTHFPAERIISAELGPVVSTHTGPGVIGVAYRLR